MAPARGVLVFDAAQPTSPGVMRHAEHPDSPRWSAAPEARYTAEEPHRLTSRRALALVCMSLRGTASPSSRNKLVRLGQVQQN